MSQKTIDVELLEAVENFVDAKFAMEWANQQKPFNDGVFQVAVKQVAEKKKELHTKLLQLTWIAGRI